jgi:hypothetical protein
VKCMPRTRLRCACILLFRSSIWPTSQQQFRIIEMVQGFAFSFSSRCAESDVEALIRTIDACHRPIVESTNIGT